MRVRELRKIAENVGGGYLAVSPDGRHIADVRRGKLVLITLEGDIREIEIADILVSNAQWLDNSRLIYQKSAEAPENMEIGFQLAVLDIHSEATYLLSNATFGRGLTGDARYTNSALSPSKTKLAFVQISPVPESAAYLWSVYILDLESSALSRLDSPGGRNCIDPVWLPNGTEIAIYCYYDQTFTGTEQQTGRWRINTQTGETTLLPYGSLQTGVFSPDGRRYIYIRDCHNKAPPTCDFYLAPVKDFLPDFEKAVRLSPPTSFWHSILTPSYFEVWLSQPAWFPDSRGLVVTGDLRFLDGTFEWGLWYVDLGP